ncbi:MAG TPA: DUF305 domain-containing protein [Nitrospirota bacterium]|nr:DUF305 domain-containing protein [Nitrospirota bacterium]
MKKAYSYSIVTTLFFALVVSSVVVVFAQHSHHGHDVQSQPAGGQEKSFQQLMDDAMITMDSGMKDAPMTGDPDHDFAAMMIPHHQGAIDMAKAELLYGKDPALRRLAQEIVVTQEQEIEVMRTRLKEFKAH